MRLRTIFALFGVLSLAGLSLLSASADYKVKLTYEETSKLNMTITSMNRQYAAATAEKPEGITKLPEKLAEEVYYMKASIGGNQVFILVAKDSETGKLYVDLDGDGDLAEEKPVESKVDRGRLSFGQVTLAPEKDGVAPKASIDFWGRGGRGGNAMIIPAGFYSGTIEGDGKKYKVALVDTNFNGIYNDVFVPPYVMRGATNFDFMAFDLNADGMLRPGYPVGEVFPMPRLMQLDGKYYSVEPKSDGTELVLKETDPKTGKLDLGSGDVELSLISDTGFYTLNGKKVYDLPEGKYQTLGVQLVAKDADGVVWKMNSTSGFGDLANFEIKKGEALEKKIGTPLTVTASVAGAGGTRSISAIVRGQAGESYVAGATKGNTRDKAPTVKIFSEKGELLEEGALKYG